MKALCFITLTAMISLSSLAFSYEIVETGQCKTRALTAASIKHKKDFPDSSVHLSAKRRSVLEDNKLYHFVDVIEYDSQHTTTYTITHNPKTCSIMSID